MAYATGSIAGPNELLSAMSTFLAANGWTVDVDAVQGSGRKLQVHRGGAYYAMRSNNATDTVSTIGVQDFASNIVKTGIWIVGGSGATLSANWYDLPARQVTNTLRRQLFWMDFNLATGPFTYHMFANSAGPYEFLVAAQYTGTGATGRWTWLGFANTMTMLGDWGQGSEPEIGAWYGASRHAYATTSLMDTALGARGPFHDQVSSSPSHHAFRGPLNPLTGTGLIEGETFAGYVDALTGTSPWHNLGNRFSATTPEQFGYTGRYHITSAKGMGSNLARCAPTIYNLADVLIPFIVMRVRYGFFPLATASPTWSNQSVSGLARSFFGYPSFIRYCDLTNRNPADTLVIGSDTWRVFPDHFKGQTFVTDTWSLAPAQSGFAVRQ